MAALYCWKTGLLHVSKKAEMPDGTMLLLYGPHQHVNSEMVATAPRQVDGTRYVPGMFGLPEDTPEEVRFAIVQAYMRLLARRIAMRTKAGRARWARMEAHENKQQLESTHA